MPNSQALLSALALAGMILLSGLMIFWKVPQENHDFMVAALSSLATALTVTGGAKLADKITNSTGPDATVQPDAPK